MDCTRRNFLKGSAILAAGAGAGMALAGCAPAATSAGQSGGPAVATGANLRYEYEADVIAVGGGGAGLIACAAAHDEGSSTLVIEKSTMLGGDSLVGFVANGFWPERRLAEGWGEDSAEDYIADLIETHEFYSRKGRKGEPRQEEYPFLERVTEIFPAACGFLEGLGVEFITIHDSSTGIEVPIPKEHGPVPCAVAPTGRGWLLEVPFVRNLEESLATYDDCTILTSCKASSLVQDEEGRVVGVTFVDGKGVLRAAKANKGIVIATGGFHGDLGMIEQFMQPELAKFKPSGTAMTSGDGIRMAQEAGAALTDMDAGIMMHLSAEGTDSVGPLTKYLHSFSAFPDALGKAIPGIFVNCEGKRFVEESRGAMEVGAGISTQPYGLGYYVGDSGSDTSWLEGFKAVRWADTLDELAQAVGVDPDAFVEEVGRYNGFVESGVDEDFGKLMDGTKKIENPPYFAFRGEPRPCVTIGGIKTDVESRVLDLGGNPIPGLYAAGVSCGCYEEQEGVLYTGGLNQAIAFGYQAGLNAAAEV